MPNIIDSLVVRLSLDGKAFDQAQARAKAKLADLGAAAEGAGKKIDAADATTVRSQRALRGELGATERHTQRATAAMREHGRSGQEYFAALTKGALLFGAALAGIRSVQDAIHTVYGVAGFGRAAANIGMAPGRLSAYGLAAKQFAGGSVAATTGAIGTLQSQYQNYRGTGQWGPEMQMLQYLGVNPTEPMDKKLLDLAHALHHMPRPRAAWAASKLGLDAGTFNLLVQGRRAVEAHLAAVAKEGVITAGQTVAMQKLQTAMESVRTSAEALGRVLLVQIAPGLTAIAKAIAGILNGDLGPAEKLATGAWQSVKESAGFTSAQQDTTRAGIMNGLVAGGLSPRQAAAFAGNAQAESGFNPAARNAGHVGLWQWSPKRRAQILAGTGIDVAHATSPQQVKALLWELHHTETGTLAAVPPNTPPWIGGQTVDTRFERSGDYPPDQIQRGRFAASAYAAWKRAHSTWTPPALPHRGAIPAFGANPLVGGALPVHVQSVLQGLRDRQHVSINTTHIGHVSVTAPGGNPHQIASAIRGLGTPAEMAFHAASGLA